MSAPYRGPKPVDFTLFQDTDPVRRFRFRLRKPDKTFEPYPLEGKTITISFKKDLRTNPVAFEYSTSAGGVLLVDDEDGWPRVVVQFVAADLDEPADYPYKVIAEADGKKELIGIGVMTLEEA